MAKQPGMVSTHAVTIRPAMPQRTAESRRVAPTPRIAPEMACVVEIGMPSRVAISITVPADVSAANPCTGVSFVMRTPMVLMIRQPPVAVPMPMETAQMTFTQSGMKKSLPVGTTPYAASASAITPIVFCPSLPPWLNAMYALERTCARPKNRCTPPHDEFRRIQYTLSITRYPKRKARAGEYTMPKLVLPRPSRSTTPSPWTATDAPMIEKMSAWLDELGRPNHHVTRSQTIAEMRAA